MRKRKEELEVANLTNKVLSGKFADAQDGLPAPPGDGGDDGLSAAAKKRAKKKLLQAGATGAQK